LIMYRRRLGSLNRQDIEMLIKNKEEP